MIGRHEQPQDLLGARPEVNPSLLPVVSSLVLVRIAPPDRVLAVDVQGPEPNQFVSAGRGEQLKVDQRPHRTGDAVPHGADQAARHRPNPGPLRCLASMQRLHGP